MPKRKFSRLTNDQKQALRGELDAKIPVTDLAKKYGVSRRTIYNLKNRWEERLPQSRSKVLTVRVSAEDMERLDALAKKLDLSRADTARRVLLYAAGVYPDWWKLEPMTSPVAWRKAIAAIEENDPHTRGIVVLGLDAPEAELAESFAVAASFPLVKGFAVGRTIFGAVARAWLDGDLTDAEAVEEMARRYGRLCGIWDKARASARVAA